MAYLPTQGRRLLFIDPIDLSMSIWVLRKDSSNTKRSNVVLVSDCVFFRKFLPHRREFAVTVASKRIGDLCVDVCSKLVWCHLFMHSTFRASMRDIFNLGPSIEGISSGVSRNIFFVFCHFGICWVQRCCIRLVNDANTFSSLPE